MLTQTILAIQKIIAQQIQGIFPDFQGEVELESPRDVSHGDYALTIALKLAKEMGRNPQEVAAEIQKVITDIPEIASSEVAGPGFINLILKDDVFLGGFDEFLKQGKFIEPGYEENMTVLIEYPSTNVAKPMAVHHLLSATIGQTLYNVAKKLGYHAISINHLGDWGTHFGKLIYSYKHFRNDVDLDHASIEDLLDIYIEFGTQAKLHPEIDEGARSEFLKLEQRDSGSLEIFQKCIDISLKDLDEVLEKLGAIHIDETLGESFYSDKMDAVIQDGISKGIFTEDKGALICKFPEENKTPALLKKSDGATLYLTRDVTTVKYRIERWKPYRTIYVVDIAQKLHFEQVFEVARMLGMNLQGFYHVGFGRMSFKDGRKMSTRSGDMVLLRDVIDEAIERAGEIIQAHNPEIAPDRLTELSRMFGVGALKYNILSQNIQTNFKFDWNDMLALEGNSAPYLQYAYARARSIGRKAGEVSERKIFTGMTLELLEKRVIHQILLFPLVVQKVFETYRPNTLANYIYELTQNYNSFYAKHSVLQAETEEKKILRVNITALFAKVLKEGLEILGIEVPEEV